MYVHCVSRGIKGIQTIEYQNQTNIEISVCFEEPLQAVELVKEEIAEISSHSANDSDDQNGSVSFDFSYLMSDISEKNISGSE